MTKKDLIRKLEAMIEASKVINMEAHGRQDCKSCSLLEVLERTVKEAESE